MAKIDKIISEYEENRTRWSELSFQLGEHYNPIIEKLKKNKDRVGLENLLDEIPDSLTKMGVYQSLRELKTQL